MMLAAAMIYDSYRGDRARAEERLQEQAQALALLVDREFDRVQTVLHTLAASAALARDDLDAFEQEIRGAGSSLRSEPVGLIAPDGHIVLSTIWVPPERHPDRRATEQLLRIFQTCQPLITDLYIGGNTHRQTIAVGIPVLANASDAKAGITPQTVKYVLSAGVPSAVLSTLLSTQRLQPGWVAGVFDRTYHVAARTKESERYVGTRALSELHDAMLTSNAGVVRAVRADGLLATTVFARAANTGFVVALAVPDNEFEAPLRSALWRSLNTGLLISGVGLALALWMARNVTASIQGLARPEKPGTLPFASDRAAATRVREVEIVAARLAQIAAERDDATAALRELAGRLEQQVSERTEALAESEARLRAIFDAQFQFITLLDPEGRRLEMNRSALDFGAVAENLIIGTPMWDAQWWRSDATTVARLKAAVARAASGYPVRLELQANGLNGKTTILDMSVRPVRDRASGAIRLLMAEGHDITELRALETRLAQTSRLEALGQLAGGVAHDFNNVMQSISGAMSLIARRAEDPAAVRRLTEMVREAIERGAAVTRRLLSFARRDVLSAAPVDVADMLDNLREVLSHTLGSAMQVTIDVPPALPPLLADRSQLETVLVNLATNARDAISATGLLNFSAEALSVTADRPLAGLSPGAYIRLTTADNGSGMDAQTLTRAAEPFFTTKREGHGTGLGLAMARGFAEQSGGAMLIESRPGAGTRVTLWLPQADAALPVITQPVAAPALHRRLLLVEDNDMLRELLAAALEAQGYHVIQAAGSAEALPVLDPAARGPDLLISDLSMPGMNGLELIRIAQRLRPELPAILLTGYVSEASSAAVRQALRGSRFILLHKPVSEEQLAVRVAALLEECKPAEVDG